MSTPAPRYTLTGPAGHLLVRGSTLTLDVVEVLAAARLSMSATEATQLDLTIEDRTLRILRTGLFDAGTSTRPGSPIDYAGLKFEARAVELDAAGALTVTARSLGVCKLRRARSGAKVAAGVSAATWVQVQAKAAGLKAVVQPSATATTIGVQKDETVWDAMQRMARELGFSCFEAAGTVYFARPSWLVSRTAAPVLPIALTAGYYQPLDGRVLSRPTVRLSSDSTARSADLSVDVLPELGQAYTPGCVLALSGMPVYSGRYLVESVDVDLADDGVVTIGATTPVDAPPDPPDAPASSTSAAFSVKTPGAGTYGGTKLTAAQVSAATKVYKQALKDRVPLDGIIIAFMVMSVEANFMSPDEAHSDRDSAGPFQQRRAWRRSMADRMDYAESAHLFFTGGDGGQRGLLDVKNWRTRPKGVVAQVVQGSAFPSRYATKERMATALAKAIAATGTSSSHSTGFGAGNNTVEAFVQLALKQAGDRYIFGAEARMSDPDPDAFDCCLVAGTMVSTTTGAVPIEDVAPGAEVVTVTDGHVSTNRVVAVAAQPVQDVFTVRTRTSAVTGSANHPFLVLERGPRERVGVPVQWRRVWRRLDELAPGDLVVHLARAPRTVADATLDDGTPVDVDVAWFVGQVIGDGHVNARDVRVAAFREDDRARLTRTAAAVWGATATPHPTHGLILGGVRIARAFTWLRGARSHTKRLPAWAGHLDEPAARALLEGYAAADGHLDKRGHLSYASASRRLIDDVRALHRALGDRVSNVTTNHRRRPITIGGVLVKTARPLHTATVYPGSRRNNRTVLDTYGARRAIPDDTLTVERVVSITPAGAAPTFDLEVDGAHNYVADGAVVHNSELVEWCAYRVGITPRVPDGTDGQWAFARRHGLVVPVATAVKTRGMILARPGHTGISLGVGSSAHGTIEAMGRKYGVLKGSTRPGRWTRAWRLPGVRY